ncbi:MAG: hypothetical protein HYZ14_12540 [Bacteroidetes bacterium]|nr:hypothetical protein [Bacteroidota bacterium]
MAIEIRELVIKTTVSENKNEGKGNSGKDSSAKEELIRECVDKVMEILKYNKER